MRAILINPETEDVTEVEWNGEYKHINELIGCDTYTLITIENGDDLFVDDEGLLKNPKYFFKWDTYYQPLAGKGLILGSEEWDEEIQDSKTQPCNITVKEAKAKITFMKLSVQGFETTESTTTLFGKEAFLIQQAAIFGPPDESEI